MTVSVTMRALCGQPKKLPPPPPIPAAAVEALLCLRAIVAEVSSPAAPYEVISSELPAKVDTLIGKFHAAKVGAL